VFSKYQFNCDNIIKIVDVKNNQS